MRIRPIGNKVLVRDLTPKDSNEEKKVGSIIVPSTADKFEISHKIVKILDISKKIENPQFKIGDEVYVNMYIGTELELESEKFLLIEPEDIYGIVE